MAKADLLNVLYSKEKSPLQFKFDMLVAPNMYTLITPYDIQQLNYIATSLRYSSNINLKYQMIDNILKPRGFKKFGCGTNRIVYKYLENSSIVLKIALDRVGMQDNPAEYNNQFLLQPFVTKVFQVSQCGTVALAERVQPITSHEEFKALGEDIYDLLVNCIIGKYVLEDIGTRSFMNYGFRNGFGPVLLDYTYVYKLDGAKLQCMVRNTITNQFCNGEIDYDEGFNNLVCTKCGKAYLGKELEEKINDNLIFVKGRGKMVKVRLTQGDKVIIDTTLGQKQSKTIKREGKPKAKIIPPTNNATIEELVKDKQQSNQSQGYIPNSMAEFIQKIPNIQPSNKELDTLHGETGRTISSQDLARQMEEAMSGARTELDFSNSQPKKSIEVEAEKYNTESSFIPKDDTNEIYEQEETFEKIKKSNKPSLADY